jgi:phosphodiesterase/alkaline phosphatase D-like protein
MARLGRARPIVRIALTAVFALGLATPLVPASLVAHAAACDPPITNRVVCENSKPGNPASEWDVVGSGDSTIQGFATDMSVDQGETVQFKVKTTATSYRIDIYRLGYYGGAGARKVATASRSTGQTQPSCLTEPTSGLIDCGNWALSLSWPVPADAVSGIYIGKLVRADNGGASHVIFIVRDDDGGSDMLFQTADTTWHAYNSYGGNSLYVGGPGTGPGRAYKVSYNRPLITRGIGGGAAFSQLFSAEYPLVRWLEANGYDVSYTSGVDSDRRGAELLEHRVFLSVGHDEYWSAQQRANVEAARDAGVHLAFFSGNEVFWKTRWENSIDGSGRPYRTLVSYKETHNNAKIDPSAIWTGTWRDPRFSPPADGGRPENALTGQLFTVNGIRLTDAINVPAADGRLRFWRNTTIATLADGQTATLPAGTLGYEWDEDVDNGSRPAGAFRLSTTTMNLPCCYYLLDHGSSYGAGTATHSMTLYRHTSGALVFGSGTVQWSWGLDATHDNAGPSADLRMRQATVNLFADMGVQPASIQSGLIAATRSSDATAPSSAITAPAGGATVTSGTPVAITGTANDTGGVVAGTEVSVDGGATWRRANGRGTWSYSWTPTTAGQTTIKSRAVDDTANLETPGAGIVVSVDPNPVVTFDDRSGQNQPLGGAYPTNVIEWGTGQWWHAAPYGSFTTKSTSFATATLTSATFTFLTPRRLEKLDVYNGGSSTSVGVACAGQPTKTQTVGAGQLATITTGWTGGCTNVTLSSTNGWATNFDNITHFPASSSDTQPPQITGVGATGVTSGSATVVWATNEISDTQVEYGLTTTYGSTTNVDPALVTSHSASLAGLAAGTTYHYRVKSRDAAGNLAISSDLSFTTLEPGASTTITFDDRSGQNQILNGQYPSGVVNWGTGIWWHSEPYGQLTTKNLTFNGPSRTSGTFTFLVPRRLVGLRAYNGGTGATTVTISCGGQPTRTQSVSSGQLATILTGWTDTCSPVTLGSTNGWDTNFDDLIIDTAPPTIAAVQTSTVDATTATVTWTTNEPADSQVEFGTTTAYGSETTRTTTLVTTHTVTLEGLQPNTLYHYRAKSRDAGTNLATSGDITFLTTDSTPPAISGVASSAVTSTSATITWSTDEPADTQLEYGTTTAYGSSTALDPALVSSHVVNLSTLAPDTTYHYRVKSKDSGGNLAVSADFTLTTQPIDTTPPVISAVQAVSVASSTATITWTTDEPSDSQVDYGLTSSHGTTTTLDPALVTSHSVALAQLAPDTTYHFRVRSKDSSANAATSLDATFTTAPPPDTIPPTISGIAVGTLTSGTATITWSTSEPATSQVEYGITASYGSSTSLDTTLLTGHSVVLQALAPNTLYHYRVQSRDAAGNLATSADLTFTTKCPCTIWPSTALPTVTSAADAQSVTLGVKFRSDVGGFITGIRFYKGAANSGTHVGALWSTGGQLLGSVTFTGETAEGWQQATLTAPVAISAGTTYVASYHAPNGGYARDVGYFATSGTDAAPLHAPSSASAGGNGVFSFGPTSTFPTNSFEGTNYWVDVVYHTSGTDSVPPEIGSVAATNVTGAGATINWQTSESATSQVDYGPTTAYGSSTAETSAFVTAHSVTLGGLSAGTTYHYRVRSRDASGNSASSADGTFTTASAPTCPCTIWSSTSTPQVASQSDTQAVTLGVKMRSDIDGYLTAVRFYKGSANTGLHRAHVWSAGGALLGIATFAGESATGWQQATLSAPVAVTAGTTYVVSYHAPNGGYATTHDAFLSAGVDAPPLHALRDGVTGGNGVYAYGPSGTFPTNTYRATNYWVDVVFDTTASDTVAPTIASVQTGSITSTGATVTWTTDESADSQVEYGTTAAYGSSTVLDPTRVLSHATTLTGLSASTTYHYRVKSRDAAGNLATTGDHTFTTAAPPPACPCSIWSPAATPDVLSFGDTGAVELGVKFRVDVGGHITAIRFYKGSGNTGTHTGHLWRSDGTLLATVTFTGETATGWQEAQLAVPVAVVPGTTYIASYHAPNGGYSVTRPGLATEITNPPLRALASAATGGNGVYAYGPSGTFPSGFYEDTNYWVDVVFTTP